MVLFTCTKLSKTFHEAPLFAELSFGMETGERVGLIGRNGVGKTTLLRIIAGIETPESGSVSFNGAVTWEYLEQFPVFTVEQSVLAAVMDGRAEIRSLLDRHEELCSLISHSHDMALQRELDEVDLRIEQMNGWSLESDAEAMLHRLGVTDFDANVLRLSGGQRKRVALARVLLRDPDLLILDEPTNHLDADSVQWLQDRLQQSHKALLLITHDRYFLDAIVNRIVELEQLQLITYPGNYELYLERREAMISAQDAEADRLRSKLRTELAWLQRGAPARRSKQKSRIDWIERMQIAPRSVKEKNITIEVGSTFLGSKVIEAVNISKRIGSHLLFERFTHHSTPGERIGIIGSNGCGKSTLLNVLSGRVAPDTGSVKIGASVNLGYFKQENEDFDLTMSVSATLRSAAEYIDTGIGRDRYLSASDMLNKFHFPPKKQIALVGTLSGGERRRLALLMVLMSNPNVLFLDEPTNDFDIQVLNALEEYLQHFQGFLLVVSHDRMFLDRTVDYIYAFEGNGTIKQYPGNYTHYLQQREKEKDSGPVKESDNKRKRQEITVNKPKNIKALTWKEERELEQIERDLALLGREQTEISGRLISDAQDYVLLGELTRRMKEIEDNMDALSERWVALEEKREQ